MENATNASTAAQQPAAPKQPALIVYYYGNGKGKTTAALGLALRASGYKKKVLFAQFIKGDWETGEDKALKKINIIEHKKFGLGFIYPNDSPARQLAHKKAVSAGMKFVKSNYRKYDIIVLDEISNAISLGLINIDDVVDLIKKISLSNTVILTGAAKVSQLVECADLVTQMKKIKHPYDKGVMAIESIDW